MMPYLSSVNIACGFHAGDPNVMNATVELALYHGVKIGAHPGLPDLAGFGRREMNVSAKEVYNFLLYQIGALDAYVKVQGGKLHHVKPHGALYNMAAVRPELAEAIAAAIYRLNPALVLYGLAGSELTRAGEKIGLQVAHEVFADRTYQDDGTLTQRTNPHAVIKNHEIAVEQVIEMVKKQQVKTVSGTIIPIKADTVCLHGDSEHAITFAKLIHEACQRENIVIEKLTVF